MGRERLLQAVDQILDWLLVAPGQEPLRDELIAWLRPGDGRRIDIDHFTILMTMVSTLTVAVPGIAEAFVEIVNSSPGGSGVSLTVTRRVAPVVPQIRPV